MKGNKQEGKDHSFFTDQAYDIYIEAFDQADHQNAIKWLPAIQVSKRGLDVIFGVFELLRDEILKNSFTTSIGNESENILSVIFKQFDLSNFDRHGSIESSLEQHLDDLKKFKFFLPKVISEVKTSKGIYSLRTVVNALEAALKSLRDERINFWECLLEKYKGNKNEYDINLKRMLDKERNHSKDISKRITSEDIKHLSEY